MAKAVTLPGGSARWGLLSLALARISLGFIFLWAFLDKLFGLGFATCRDAAANTVEAGCSSAWINGGSPTEGFLTHGTSGPFAGMFQSMAGAVWADWLFMAGLLGLGVALMAGVAVRLAAALGSLLLLLMWLAALWPANNPAVDEHIVYIFVLAAVAAFDKHQKLGLGAWWQKQAIAQRLRWLR